MKFYNLKKYFLIFIMICLLPSCYSKYKNNNINNISPSTNAKFKESFMLGCVNKAEGILGEKYCSCTYDKFVEKYGIREFIHYFSLIGQGKTQLKEEDEAIIRECILVDFEPNEDNKTNKEDTENTEENTDKKDINKEINEENIYKENIGNYKDENRNSLSTIQKQQTTAC